MKSLKDVIAEYNKIARIELNPEIKSNVNAIMDDINTAQSEGHDFLEVGAFYTKTKRPEIIYFN